jgi:hypothetical protein
MNDTGSILVAHCGSRKVTREELKEIPVPEGTRSHQPLSHFEIVEVLDEALSFRSLQIYKDEYAVSNDGMKMFGVMDLRFGFDGGRFSIGLRNSNDKSMRLALTAGYRVFVCDNLAFSGDFTPLLHKHTRNLDLTDSISIAVDRIHRGFATLEMRVKEMREHGLTDNDAKLLIYRAFLEREIKGAPRNLMTVVHDYYFNPTHEAFVPRNLWSLSNAFTSAFKQLAPIRMFETTARLGSFLTGVQDQLNRRPEEPVDLKVEDEFYSFPEEPDSHREPDYAGKGFNNSIEAAVPFDPVREVVEDVRRQEASPPSDDEDMAEILTDHDDFYEEDEFYEKEEEAEEVMEEYERQVAA